MREHTRRFLVSPKSGEVLKQHIHSRHADQATTRPFYISGSSLCALFALCGLSALAESHCALRGKRRDRDQWHRALARKKLTKWMWSIPIVSEPAELESRPKKTLTWYKKNSFLVIIASDPIVLPECDSPTQSHCGELLVQLGRQTNVRAWMVLPLPDDAVEKPSSDSRAASEIDLRHILTYGYLLKFTTPLSGEEFPSTTEGVVERLDRFAVPIEGTLAIERPTNWTTRARLGGCANDEPFQLVIDCSHGSRFDPQGLARGIGLLAILPVLALSTALGGPPP